LTISTGPILVVEDIAAVRELIEVQLKLRGYNVVTARDGQEALELVATAHPAVVITDILMPRLDGFALAQRLRADPRTTDIPVIFLSATYVSAEDERFALHLGALRFLPKPVDADELFIAVADALTGQAQPALPLSEQEFYVGYRQRLEAKLRQKAAQVARNQQQLDAVPADQRETYRRLLAESQQQHAELQRELGVLATAMQGLK
jgi:CheY-like chemotaxis protein